eukprot:352743-Chlamydomonas_euryale.AAC.17
MTLIIPMLKPNDAVSNTPASPSRCPLGFDAAAGVSANVAVGAAATRPAECPLGFKSGGVSGGEPLSRLHCTLCRTYLHGCTACVPCGHKFCRCACGAARAAHLRVYAWGHACACGRHVRLVAKDVNVSWLQTAGCRQESLVKQSVKT